MMCIIKWLESICEKKFKFRDKIVLLDKESFYLLKLFCGQAVDERCLHDWCLIVVDLTVLNGSEGGKGRQIIWKNPKSAVIQKYEYFYWAFWTN